MNTNSIPYLDQALQINSALLGLPALPLVFLGCLVLGYALKAVPVYPNRWIPAGVFIGGILGNLALGGWAGGRSLILGLIAAGLAWVAHAKYLSKWIDPNIFEGEDTQQITKPPEGGFIEVRLLQILAVLGLIAVLGCAVLQPGADPLVVNVERVQTTSTAAFDMIVGLDHADRGFWQTNAPAFHAFVEELRAPVAVRNLPQGRTTLPRYIASLWELDQAKLVYKSVKSASSSNALVAAQLSLQGLADQTHAWLTIITNKPKI